MSRIEKILTGNWSNEIGDWPTQEEEEEEEVNSYQRKWMSPDDATGLSHTTQQHLSDFSSIMGLI